MMDDYRVAGAYLFNKWEYHAFLKGLKMEKDLGRQQPGRVPTPLAIRDRVNIS